MKKNKNRNMTSTIVRAGRLLLCTTALLCLSSTRSWAGAGKITEPKTGVTFLKKRMWGSHHQAAVGVAMKKKVFFNVYAACFYIDQKLGKQALLKLARAKSLDKDGSIDKTKLLKSELLYRWLIDSDLAMTIDLTFVRSFGYSNFKENYQKKLGLFLKDKQLIERFLSQPSGDIKKFGHLTFNLMPKGKVILQYMGKTLKPIISRPLKKAVLSTFFHRSSDSQIRIGLVKEIDRLLK